MNGVGSGYHDIIDTIDRIDSYIAGLDLADFRQDQKTIDAVERCLSRISEAAVKLGDVAPQLVPEMPWADIRGIGNHLLSSRGPPSGDYLICTG